MAMSQITLDTEQVISIANQIKNDNDKLSELLQTSKQTIDNLSSVWSGEASEKTRESYNGFADKFFKHYYDVLDQYVKFLNQNVAEQYAQVETANVKLADAFK